MKALPRVRCAHLPTPVEPLPRLSKVLGGPDIWIKRDDQTGLALGGNKARKLEFLVADARQNNASTLITAGAVQSNHCRQTAAAAARFGFDCILVLAGEPAEQYTGNLFLDQILGAEIVWTRGESRDRILLETYEDAQRAGRQPYLIPYGGSNPVGAVSYALAIQELRDQGAQPDWVVVPSSSGWTQAGMVLGARMFGLQCQILGISIDEKAADLRQRVSNLAAETGDRLGEHHQFHADDILVNDEYLGGGYGVMGELEREAIELFAKYEGILLDPVYTGRAAGGMIDLIRAGFYSAGSTILFWHTGGTPALFADKYLPALI
jgi:D-cysteine desulfhydrase family pyridoxal phosphate-dependent enzyme